MPPQTLRTTPPAFLRALLAACSLPLALMSGCAATVRQLDAVPTIEVPAAWSHPVPKAGSSPTSLASWWQQFDDPLLGRLVEQAMQSNTSVASAQAALRQAWALRDVAAAALLPTLRGTASAQHGTSGGDSTGNSFQAGLNGNWVPDVFGANRSALNAAIATAQASTASLGDVQVSIAAEVGLNYITLRGAQSRFSLASANLASQEETLQITRWRQEAGLVTALEAEQARASAAQTRAQLPLLRTAIEQSRHAIAVLTGRPPAALQTLLADSMPVPRAAPGLALSIPAETLRQRADVRAAERKVAAALARVGQADAARLPSFALGGSVGLSALTLGTLTNAASVLTSVLASMAAPLFDGGAARAQVQAQQAAYEQARFAYQAAVLTALKDVEDALIALQGDQLRLASLRNAADAATTASLLARQRYSSGLVDFQVVLETQRTQFSTQDSVAGAQADVGSDHVRLYRALGGGWRTEADSATALPTVPPALANAALTPRTETP